MNEANEIMLGPPIEPSPLSMSYSGTGWIVLYTVLALIILFIAARWVIYYQKNAYRRMAIKALDFLLPAEPSTILNALSILKSTAMKTYGRPYIAQLTGRELFEYFNQIYPAFDSQIVEQVSSAVYSDKARLSVEENELFITQIKNWIRKHGV